MIGVYGLYNIFNFKFYVGASKNIEERVEEHYWEAGRKRKGSRLYRAMYKFGEENFYPIILDEVDHCLLNNREVYWIDRLDSINNGYNENRRGWQDVVLYTSKNHVLNDVDIENIKQMRYNNISWDEVSKKYKLSITVIQKLLWDNEYEKYKNCEWLKSPLA